MKELYAGCYTDTLPNGLKVLFEPCPGRPLSVGIWARLGSRDEPAARAGISHFLEHMIFKGTAHRTAFQISEEIDAIGGTLNAMTSKEYTAYHVDVLPQHLGRVLELLADLIRNPLFRAEDLAREKNVILEEIRMLEDDPQDVVFERFHKRLWEDEHPLARPVAGFARTVNALTREDLLERFDLYDAQRLSLVAVGGIEADDLIRAAETQLGTLRCAERPLNERFPPRPQGGFHLEDRELQQAHIALGTAGVSKDDPRRYALEVMNTILGGGMSSRLFKRIREELGLAYAVFSHTSTYSDSGSFMIYLGTEPANARHALEICREEMETLCEEPVPPETLQLAKEKIKGNMLLGLESSHARMMRLGMAEVYDHHRSIDEVIARVEGVTAEEVQQIARDLFGRTFALSVVGAGKHLASLEDAVPLSIL